MTALRQDVARLYREVCARGLNVGSSGNVSARAGLGMIITPSGVRGDTVDPADLVRMDFAGGHEGPLAPSSEWAMHAAIYRADPAARVVVHTHSDAATAWGALGLCGWRPMPCSAHANWRIMRWRRSTGGGRACWPIMA